MTSEILHPAPPNTSRTRIIAVSLILALVGTALIRAGAAFPASLAPPAALYPSNGAYIGARVEPRGGESQYDAIERVESQIGRKLDIDHYYYQWTNNFPGPAQEWTVDQGKIPFINWKSGGDWSEIANGSEDDVIVDHARSVKEFGSPIYLTFHHEPENDLGSYGTPSEYAAAFRRIVDIFRANAVPNVAFVWTMMSWTMNPRSGRDPSDYYPGDSYIDFVGADGYNFYPGREGDQWNSFETIFTDVNDWAVARGKPWMVVEWGAQEDPSDPGRKAEWLLDALATAKTWPALKALIYFHVPKLYPWDTDSSSSSMTAYRVLASDPYMNPIPGVPVPTPSPSPSPSPVPSPSPRPSPSPVPSPSPSPAPSPSPSPAPSPWPWPWPSPSPSPVPSPSPTPDPWPWPWPSPTPAPSPSPTPDPWPWPSPTPAPSPSPTPDPTQLTNSFNEGAHGQALSTWNGGGDPFDRVVDDDGSLTLDASHTRGDEGFAVRHEVGYRGNAYYSWGSGFSWAPTWYGRVYVWFDSLPEVSARLIRSRGEGSLRFAIDLLGSGRLSIKDSDNQPIATTSTPVLAGGWVRIEWMVNHATGTVWVVLFNSPNSTTPTETLLSPDGMSIGSYSDQVHIGRSGSQRSSVEFWTDDPAIGTGGFLGPVP